jgi:hypothetical protein
MTKRTTDYCITYWQTIKRQAEEGIRPKHEKGGDIFSEKFDFLGIIKYCDLMIEKNKEDLSPELK